MHPDIDHVISFWFDRPPMEWIIAPEGLDAELKAQFSDLVAKARSSQLDDWAPSAEGSLALVVMLDRFSRNIYRDSADAWSADEKAWETATRAIAQGFDKVVTVLQASAFYMPLMQKESLISVIAARGLFETLKSRCVSEEEHKWVGLGIMAAGGHMEQLLRFGRYPSRNKFLGRANTEAEEEFLEEHLAKRVAELKKNIE
jgi:uncharacterized protein (DUF924 family)